MKIKVISKKNDSCELIKFIDEMFEEWFEKSCFTKENSCCPGRTKDQIIDKIEKIDDGNYQFIIAIDEQQIVRGMLYISYFDDGSAYLGLINVHPEYRNKNIFKSLLLQAEQECNNRNLQYIRLYTWKDNINAVTVFEKCGFSVCDKEKNQNSIEMRKMLK